MIFRVKIHMKQVHIRILLYSSLSIQGKSRNVLNFGNQSDRLFCYLEYWIIKIYTNWVRVKVRNFDEESESCKSGGCEYAVWKFLVAALCEKRGPTNYTLLHPFRVNNSKFSRTTRKKVNKFVNGCRVPGRDTYLLRNPPCHSFEPRQVINIDMLACWGVEYFFLSLSLILWTKSREFVRRRRREWKFLRKCDVGGNF